MATGSIYRCSYIYLINYLHTYIYIYICINMHIYICTYIQGADFGCRATPLESELLAVAVSSIATSSVSTTGIASNVVKRPDTTHWFFRPTAAPARDRPHKRPEYEDTRPASLLLVALHMGEMIQGPVLLVGRYHLVGVPWNSQDTGTSPHEPPHVLLRRSWSLLFGMEGLLIPSHAKATQPSPSNYHASYKASGWLAGPEHQTHVAHELDH